LSASDRLFEAGRILCILKDAENSSRFGYRMQGLAVHVFARIGYEYQVSHNVGHPDILLRHHAYNVRVQVKTTQRRSSRLTLVVSEADLEGIRPNGPCDRGLLVMIKDVPLLECLLIDFDAARPLAGRDASFAYLSGLSLKDATASFTNELADVVLRNAKKLPALTYERLVRMADRNRIL
jgi:hypothetical protein